MAERFNLPTTQRAYTLRLAGADPADQSWRDALWATHEAVNKGAKVFGDWLLTMRGGLDHRLVETEDGNRNSRRSLLALSWLSVESAMGAPNEFIVAHTLDRKSGERSNWQTVPALERILKRRGLPDDEIASWISDCKSSLSAGIREDAVWVNRGDAFDKRASQAGEGFTSDDVWDFLGRFFGAPSNYTKMEVDDGDDENTSSPKPRADEKDLVQDAGQWLSSRFGTGKGADFGTMASVYERITAWTKGAQHGADGKTVISSLARDLTSHWSISCDLTGVLGLISGPGYKSATRNVLAAIARQGVVSSEDIDRLRASAELDARKCGAKKGAKGRRTYSDAVLADAESACGFTYLQDGGPARHSEFAVMLDHAARRVSSAHSWIKLAEARRREFDSDARKIEAVPAPVRAWLNHYCETRSIASGSLESYRIRKRATDGWREIVKSWTKIGCLTESDRITAARALQDEIEKFGDIQLFEALASDDALQVWRRDGIADPQPLLDYVAAITAEASKRRFKVPAYRHPDLLRHPVFCDFGCSRWKISFQVHEAKKKGLPETQGRDWNRLLLAVWQNGTISDTVLRWQSRRLTHDLGMARQGASEQQASESITRNDRLGRAAAGLRANAAAEIKGIFQQKDWNGRLQAPRAQLHELATRVTRHGWDAKAQVMRDRIRWLISFTARLQPQGPWLEFAGRSGLHTNPKYWPHAMLNKARTKQARLILSRLPALRVLSVDLGHRYAAACAVWEALSARQMAEACRAAGQRIPIPEDLCQHLITNGRTVIYRRIGADQIVDAKSGEVKPHPAPWARLDRQFLIKLQGEYEVARRASPEEIEAVERLERQMGRGSPEKRSKRVDDLMSDAVRMVRVAIQRHGRRARIAYNLTASKKLLPGAREEKITAGGLEDLLTDTLVDWYLLATDARWTDNPARKLWTTHIQPLPGGFPLPEPREETEDVETSVRKKPEKELEAKIKLIAVEVAKHDRMKLHILWATYWRQEDTQWRGRLRWLRDWILPRKSKVTGAIRHVGGLSLQRIATIKSLYQVQKAFRMRPDPDDLRKNIPEKGDDTLTGFGQSVLDTMERMRENRVKQLASRIVEAALGIGFEQPKNNGRDPRRPRERIRNARFAPCHAVVIENLQNYRPEETRTRRENRQLMSWSSGKVRDYLSEACQLNGLHMREVSAGYTSRQDSRTGAPGVRCVDVPVAEFMESSLWKRDAARAAKKGQGKGDERDRYILELRDLAEKSRSDNPVLLRKILRIPARGGDIFVSADRSSPAANGLQADLNAAANIGLKALLDPDWPGRWWHVPCITATGKPDAASTKGSLAMDGNPILLPTTNDDSDSTKSAAKKKSLKGGSEVINAWRHVSSRPLSEGEWHVYAAYQNIVLRDVVGILRSQLRRME